MADHIATGRIMSVPYSGRLWLTLLLTPLLGLTACSTLNNVYDSTVGKGVNVAGEQIVKVIKPYKLEVVQGNFVSSEQVQLLKPGLTRAQVKDLLGTPMVTSVFHGERWDYAFSLKRQGVEPQARKLTVVFKGDLLDHFEGDPMPTEAEFVASLDTRQKGAKPPVLEASPETLKALAASRTDTTPEANLPPLPATYPPLEGEGS